MENITIIKQDNTAGNIIIKVLYTGEVHITGGREGSAKSSDDRLNIQLSNPGTSGKGTNPEQLLAAGWSACFLGAVRLNASSMKITLPEQLSVDAEVDLASSNDGFLLQARLNVNLPGLTEPEARQLVEAAHITCPYSKATKGNINVVINVVL